MSKQRLERIRAELQQKLRGLTGRPVSATDLVKERSTDLIDEVQAEMSVALAVSTVNIDWVTAKAVAAALDRITTGDYGICEGCADAISEKRLEAIPWAALCVRCQSLQETQARRPGAYDEAA